MSAILWFGLGMGTMYCITYLTTHKDKREALFSRVKGWFDKKTPTP